MGRMKTLIAVLTCARYLDRRNAVRDTWMPWVTKLNADVDVKFFSGKEPCLADDSCGDIVHLYCPDTYDELPQKTLKLIEYTLAHGYDRLIKVDDDTFFAPLPEYFLAFEHDYAGNVRQRPPHNDFVDYAQGGCYTLSRVAMEAVLAQGLPKTGLEDGNVGKALKAAGILPKMIDRCKTDYRHGQPRMGNDIISAHSMTPQIMHDIFDGVHLGLLARYNETLNKQSTPDWTDDLVVKYGDVKVTAPMDSATICVTSCGRHDLLRRTLESLGKTAIDLPIKETVIIEDSDAKRPEWLNGRLLGLGEIRWMSNGRRLGQWQSIDRMYDTVKTELIFHCEDDWEFDGRPFLAASAKILKEWSEVVQVSLRGDDNTSGHPNVLYGRGDFKIQLPYWRDHWGGFSGNPGLRRKSDWQRIRSYGAVAGYGKQPILGEQRISRAYLDTNRVIAVLPTDKPFIRHLGEKRSKAIDHLPPKAKVLIAVPACHKYAYGSHANDLKIGARQTEGRIEAVRATWWNDVKPFGDYVDAKFFYGSPSPVGFKPKPDEVLLNVPDDYEHLPHKMQAIYKWALAHGYDYVFKADDDGFVYVDRLLRLDYERWDQIGFSNCPHGLGEKCGCYVTGGAGYFLSKRAMQAVVSEPITHWAEDLTTGKALRRRRYKRTGHPGFLPGFAAHFVDVNEIINSGIQYVALHAVTPEGMHRLYGK
jgi:hypothetical protein